MIARHMKLQLLTMEIDEKGQLLQKYLNKGCKIAYIEYTNRIKRVSKISLRGGGPVNSAVTVEFD